jgi:TRAP-type C4-dicarboxylate transport system permease small subunit
MNKIEQWIVGAAYGMNILAATAVFAMMMLTCADVFLRVFRHPIPGTYEIVGFLGALYVSFSLAHTSHLKGHIAVDFLIQKFSSKTRSVAARINDCLSAILFALITWQTFVYAGRLKSAGEVSMTLHLPVFPIIYGIGAGCALLFVLLTFRCIGHASGVSPKK